MNLKTGVSRKQSMPKFGFLCFLETPVLRFALLAYHQGFKIKLLTVLYRVTVLLSKCFEKNTTI